jgi:hypothetical protein
LSNIVQTEWAGPENLTSATRISELIYEPEGKDTPGVKSQEPKTENGEVRRGDNICSFKSEVTLNLSNEGEPH